MVKNLEKRLKAIGIPVVAGKVKKSDIKKALAEEFKGLTPAKSDDALDESLSREEMEEILSKNPPHIMTEDGYDFFKIDNEWTTGDLNLGTDKDLMDLAESGDTLLVWYKLDSKSKKLFESAKERFDKETNASVKVLAGTTNSREEVDALAPTKWDYKVSVMRGERSENAVVLYETYPIEINNLSNLDPVNLDTTKGPALKIAKEVFSNPEPDGVSAELDFFIAWFDTDEGEYELLFEVADSDLLNEWNTWLHDRDNDLFEGKALVDISNPPKQPTTSTKKNNDFKLEDVKDF